MRCLAVIVAVLSLGQSACGGGKGTNKAPDTPTPDVTNPAEPKAGADAGAVVSATRVLTAADCESLLEHMFGHLYQHKTESLPENEQPSPEDMQMAKDSLRAELMKRCEGAAPESFAFDCVMASTSFTEMARCSETTPAP